MHLAFSTAAPLQVTFLSMSLLSLITCVLAQKTYINTQPPSATAAGEDMYSVVFVDFSDAPGARQGLISESQPPGA